ncbi:MAG: hypothetical protein ACRCZF_25360 [Gemmataceae bacterium]
MIGIKVSEWSWNRAAAVLGAAAMVAAAGWFGIATPFLILIAITLLLLSCYEPSEGILLLGPFLRFDLLRQTRKQRIHLWRTVIVGLGCVPVSLLYYYAYYAEGPNRIPVVWVRPVAEGVLLFYIWHVFLIFSAMTATFVSTAVVEDREAKRLDFLLVTDLTNREIVIGKSIVRSLGSFAYVAGLLPLFVLLPNLFGVDPSIIIACWMTIAVTVFSVTGAAALGSVKARTKKMAGQYPARFFAPYGVMGILLEMLANYPRVWFFPGSPIQQSRYAVSDLVDAFNIGNPIAMMYRGFRGMFGGFNIDAILDALPAYAGFHIALGFIFFFTAVRKLRTTSADLAGEAPTPTQLLIAEKRPAVWDRPILWKEFYVLPAPVRTRANIFIGRILIFVFAILPMLVLIGITSGLSLGVYEKPVLEISRMAPGLILLVSVAFHGVGAAGTIARERERDTLTSLLTTALTPSEIFREKMLAIFISSRWLTYWFLMIGIPGVAAGCYSLWAFLGISLQYVACVVLAVAWGMVVTARAATTEQATRRVMLPGITVQLGGMVVMAMALSLFPLFSLAPPPFFYGLFLGLFPFAGPFALGHSNNFGQDPTILAIVGYLLGILINLLLAGFFWKKAQKRFRVETETVLIPPVPPH